ncbi:MAG: hypothetical protein M1828_006059 [Chrysothrix sp. TS-e1954]|nr:MAG: hypothetical protein M1828_006059 [Chrysothrix sp. TS-e1954]
MGVPKVSKRLVAAYVLDWLLIVVFLLISYGLNFLTPRYHAFSLVDLDISFPYVDEIVSTAALIVASVVGPAVIILLVSFTLVPSPAAHRGFAWKTLIGLKFWELNIGWLGLALSEATALLVTQGLKNIIGKPRPDLLSRCNPNVDNIAAHTVGGYAARYSAEWVLLSEWPLVHLMGGSSLPDPLFVL